MADEDPHNEATGDGDQLLRRQSRRGGLAGWTRARAARAGAEVGEMPAAWRAAAS